MELRPVNLDVITCFVQINIKNAALPLYVDRYLKIFPTDEYLLEMRISSYVKFENIKEAEKLCKKALEVNT